MEFLYCIIYLAIMSLTVFIIGRIYPRKWIKENKFPFKSFRFEKNGKIYEKIKIKKWKTKLPDASLLLHKFMPKKRLETKSMDKVKILIKETCVAETTHSVAGILGFVCVLIWKKYGGWILSIVFFLINIPFVLIQRYNRPRLLALSNKA